MASPYYIYILYTHRPSGLYNNNNNHFSETTAAAVLYIYIPS